MGFFNDWPRFLETSGVAGAEARLNLRHEAIIEANQDLLAGKRVLDVAAHDGRWSFAALQAGAAHVTSVEARPNLVAAARETFDAYQVDKERYDIAESDVFGFLASPPAVDVVLCLGFWYHTIRWPELLHGFATTGARHLIVDTNVLAKAPDKAIVQLFVNHENLSNGQAVADAFSHRDRTLAGTPSEKALRKMLEAYGWRIEHKYDWPQVSTGGKALNDYRRKARVTWRLSKLRAAATTG